MPKESTLPRPLPPSDRRLVVPLFTSRELARYVRVPASTMRNWIRGYDYPTGTGSAHAAPIVTSVAKDQSRATVPFIGLAEAIVVSGFKQKSLTMQQIRAALAAIQREVGIPHALANKTLYTAGASIVWDYARKAGDEEIAQLVEPSTGQKVFTEAVRESLRLITYDADWWAAQIELPAFHPTRVVVDMKRGFGRPILDKHRLAIDDILQRFYDSHDSIEDIAEDLELDRSEVENVIRAAWRPASAA